MFFKTRLDTGALQHRCRREPVSESSLIKLKAPGMQFYWRNSNTNYSLWNLRNFLRAPCFTEHLQWLLLKVSGYRPATLLKKKLPKRCLSENFAKFLRTTFLLTEDFRMTAFCVYLWILKHFSEHFFYRARRRNCLFYVKVVVFQLPDTVKNYFTGVF